MKNNAEGHVISEPVPDNSDDLNAHPNKSNVGTGIAIFGSVLVFNGVITGATTVTAIGVTMVLIGGIYYLEGK